MSTTTTNTPYRTLRSTLLSPTLHTFFSRPTSPKKPHVPPSHISTLNLHPTLESALHILNLDLPSAHFLLRHSQAPPAYESMYLHGILHRVEGDVDNARAWYANVEEGGTGVIAEVWGQGEEWKGFLDRVERWRWKGKRKGEVVDWEGEERELNAISLRELRKVVEICEGKFGVDEVLDASGEYTMNGEHKDMAAKMITGGEGWREF